MKRWVGFILSIGFILLFTFVTPLLVNYILIKQAPPGLKVASGDWMGFYGNFTGAIVGTIGSFLVAIFVFTRENRERKHQEYITCKFECAEAINYIIYTTTELYVTLNSMISYLVEKMREEDRRLALQTACQRFDTQYSQLLDATVKYRTHMSMLQSSSFTNTVLTDTNRRNFDEKIIHMSAKYIIMREKLFIQILKNIEGVELSEEAQQESRKELEALCIECSTACNGQIDFLNSLK